MGAVWSMGMAIKLVGNEFATGMQHAGRQLKDYFRAAEQGLKQQEREIDVLAAKSRAASRDVTRLRETLADLRVQKPRGQDALSQGFQHWQLQFKQYRDGLEAARRAQRSLLNDKTAADGARASARMALQPHLDALKQLKTQAEQVREVYRRAVVQPKTRINQADAFVKILLDQNARTRGQMEAIRRATAPAMQQHALKIGLAGRNTATGRDEAKILDQLRAKRDLELEPLRKALAGNMQRLINARAPARWAQHEIDKATQTRDEALAHIQQQRLDLLNTPAHRAAVAGQAAAQARYGSAAAAVRDQQIRVKDAENLLSRWRSLKPDDARSPELLAHQARLAAAQQELADKQRVAHSAREELEDKRAAVKEARRALADEKRERREAFSQAREERKRTLINLTAETMMLFGMLRGGAQRIFSVADKASDFQYQARGLSAMLQGGASSGLDLYKRYRDDYKYQQEVSPTDAMARMRQLAAAGYTEHEIPGNTAAIYDVIQAAKGEITPEGAFQLGINMHRNFGGRYRSMRSVLDTSVKAGNVLPMTIGQVADAAGYGVEAAGQMGQTPESMLAAIGMLMPVTKTPSRAGTVYRNTALSLAKPRNQQMLSRLGINVVDSNNQTRDIMQVMFDINDELAKLKATNLDPRHRQRAAEIEAEIAQIDDRALRTKRDASNRESFRQDRIRKHDLKAELANLQQRADVTPTRMLREQLMFQFGGQRGGAIFTAIESLTRGAADASLRGTALEGAQFKDARAAWEAMTSGLGQAAGEAKRLADEMRDTSKILKDSFAASLERATIAAGEVLQPFVDAMRGVGKRGLDWMSGALGGAQGGAQYKGPGLTAHLVAGATTAVMATLAIGTVTRVVQAALIANNAVAKAAAAQGIMGAGMGLGGAIAAGGNWLGGKISGWGGTNYVGSTAAKVGMGVGSVAGALGAAMGPLIALGAVVGTVVYALKTLQAEALDFSKRLDQQSEHNSAMFMTQMEEFAKFKLGQQVSVTRLLGSGVTGQIGSMALAASKQGMNPLEAMDLAWKKYEAFQLETAPVAWQEKGAKEREAFNQLRANLEADLPGYYDKIGRGNDAKSIRLGAQAARTASITKDFFATKTPYGSEDMQRIKKYYEDMRGGNTFTADFRLGGFMGGPSAVMDMADREAQRTYLDPAIRQTLMSATPKAFEQYFEDHTRYADAKPSDNLAAATKIATELTKAVQAGNTNMVDTLNQTLNRIYEQMRASPGTFTATNDGVQPGRQ